MINYELNLFESFKRLNLDNDYLAQLEEHFVGILKQSQTQKPKHLREFLKISRNLKSNQGLFNYLPTFNQVNKAEIHVYQQNQIESSCKVHEFEDLNHKFDLFKRAGVGLNESLIALLRKFFIEKSENFHSFEFFGCFFTLKGSLYVVIAKERNTLKAIPESINSFSVFATSNFQNWVLLPNLTPREMRDSQSNFKMIDFCIETCSIDELKRLKCHILRIYFGNKIIPNNYKQLKDNLIEKNEDFEFSAFKGEETEEWTYEFPAILPCGDTNLNINTNDEELRAKLEEANQMVLFKKISEDVNKNWIIIKPSNKDFVKDNRENSYREEGILITNNIWKGSYTVYSQIRKEFFFIYNGDSLRKSKQLLNKTFPEILKEPIWRKVAVSEPNPTEEEEENILETDSEPEQALDNEE